MTTSRRAKLLELLPKLLEAHGYIGNLWHIDDVKVVRPDLTTDQCLQVLKQCESHHDACIGINWDVLTFHADELFPEGDEAAQN